jgi:hypothetical protein
MAMVEVMVELRRAARGLALVVLSCASLAQASCAPIHEEPPAPPPPPVDKATLGGPLRAPAPDVNLDADLDSGVIWADAATGAAPEPVAVADAGRGAQAPKPKKARP